jgi:hypothetical protein
LSEDKDHKKKTPSDDDWSGDESLRINVIKGEKEKEK